MPLVPDDPFGSLVAPVPPVGVGATGPTGRRDDAGGRRALLRSVLASSHRLDAVVDRSYWHPNGFLKVVLAGGSGGAQVRLHVWFDPTESGDIHDHAWSYESVVLTGAVQEVVYRRVPAGEGRRLWCHPYGTAGPGRFRLDPPVEVHLAEGERRVVRAGGRSGGAAHHVHRFWAEEAPAITFLHVEPASRGVSHVYRTDPAAQPTVSPRRATRTEVATWVEHALALP